MPESTSPSPENFREQLSAWHDGALPSDTARFVARRLLNDEALRSEVGRWQVIGDALRQQPQQQTSPDFAARVTAALDVEALATKPVQSAPRPENATQPSRLSRPLALGWATAAALALAAVLVLPRDEASQTPGFAIASAPAAAVASADASSLVTPRRTQSVNSVAPVLRRIVVAPSSASIAVASVPPLVRAPQPTAEQLAPLPPPAEPAARPWPRSGAANSAYTVDYAVPLRSDSPQQ